MGKKEVQVQYPEYLMDDNGHLVLGTLGWYFIDETDDINGPFPTWDSAEKAYIRYCGAMT